MRIALFGGSFNPIHNDHLGLINKLFDKNLVDQVFIIPCKNHAFSKDLASVEDRINMISLAITKRRVRVDRTEADSNSDKNYSIDTVRKIKKLFPKDEFYFVIGSDILQNFDKWHKSKELIEEVKFIIFKREGYNIISSNINPSHILDGGSISSTKIREKISKGGDIDSLVPKKVEEYIKEKKLYS